jgi:hypothetical protein
MDFKTYVESIQDKKLASAVLEGYELIYKQAINEATFQKDPSFGKDKLSKGLAFIQNVLDDSEYIVDTIDKSLGKIKENVDNAKAILTKLKRIVENSKDFLNLDSKKQEQVKTTLNTLIQEH